MTTVEQPPPSQDPPKPEEEDVAPPAETLKDLTKRILEGHDSSELLNAYREQDDISDSDSGPESDIVLEPATQEEEVVVEDPKVRKYGFTAKGELTLDELPPVEKLTITVPQDHLEHIGDLYSFVDKLVVVESVDNRPVLNLDTVLFLEDGRAIGQVFDVIGPVRKPYYVLRFNNTQEIADEHLEKGVKVFCAPKHHDYTFFVFERQLQELIKMKGSDASWENDVEPPEHEIEYSDDEEERAAKQERRAKRTVNGLPVERRDRRNGANNTGGQQCGPTGGNSVPSSASSTTQPASANAAPQSSHLPHPIGGSKPPFEHRRRSMMPMENNNSSNIINNNNALLQRRMPPNLWPPPPLPGPPRHFHPQQYVPWTFSGPQMPPFASEQPLRPYGPHYPMNYGLYHAPPTQLPPSHPPPHPQLYNPPPHLMAPHLMAPPPQNAPPVPFRPAPYDPNLMRHPLI